MRISDWSSDVCSSDLGYGDDPAKTFTQAPQNGLILPGMVTQIDDENSVSVEPGAARAVEVRRTELWRLSAAVEAIDKKDIGRSLIGHHEVRTVSPDYLKAVAAGWHATLIGDVDDIPIDIQPAARSPGQELVTVFCQRPAAPTDDLARFW